GAAASSFRETGLGREQDHHAVLDPRHPVQSGRIQHTEDPVTMMVGILGLARSGRAAAHLALSRGMRVYASDAGDSAELRATAESIRAAGGTAETGGHDVAQLATCDLIVISPGIPPTATVLSDARVAAVLRVSELEFAFRHIESPVLAI